MILDKLANRHFYFKGAIFDELFYQLSLYDINTPNGVYKNHEDFYFKVMSYDTKLDSTITESHRKEVDIQILFSGKEGIKIFSATDVEIIKPYYYESDCQFYKPIKEPFCEITLEPGYMAVFFPDDIHNPQVAVFNKIEKLKKIVIKVNEKLFTHK